MIKKLEKDKVSKYLDWHIRTGNGFYHKGKRYTSVIWDKEDSFFIFNRDNGDADRVYYENLKGKLFPLNEKQMTGNCLGVEIFN